MLGDKVNKNFLKKLLNLVDLLIYSISGFAA